MYFRVVCALRGAPPLADMPIFTSLLFFLIALAFLPLALRTSHARSAAREQAILADRMALGASICIAAARDAFGIELDRSMGSINALDALISQGWGNANERSSPLAQQGEGVGGEALPDRKPNDLTFVLAAYLGTTYCEHSAAHWRIENGTPALFFQVAKVSAYPFDLIERKLRDPEQVHLEEAIAEWGKPLEADNRERQDISPAPEASNIEPTDGPAE